MDENVCSYVLEEALLSNNRVWQKQSETTTRESVEKMKERENENCH